MPDNENDVVLDPLKDLNRSRGTIKFKLTSLEKYINTIKNMSSDNQPNLIEVEVRFNGSSKLLDEFDAVQTLIESRCEENQLNQQFLEREQFQERFYAAHSFLIQFLASLQPPSASSANESSQTQHNVSVNVDTLQNVLLPKLKLPVFSGEFQLWLSFKNNFTATISSSTTLNEYQKFQFLKASLQGYASRFTEGLENNDKPFEKAWSQLCERFDKKQFLLDSHFKSILNIPGVQKDTYYNFRKMLDEVSKNLTSLDAIGISKDILYDSFLIHILSSKLDKSTIKEWKECKHEGDSPTLNEFLNFLKNKLDILQCLDDSQFVKSNSFNKPYNNKIQTSAQVHIVTNISCNFCKKDHTIYKCPDFLALSVDKRIKEVKRLTLCENCLLTGHNKSNCKLRPCIVCKVKKHNTLLHKDFLQLKNPDTGSSSQSNAVILHQTDTVTPNININFASDTKTQVLLSTIICNIQDAHGEFHECRALLDCGAQMNLVTDKFCKKLNIHTGSTNCTITGVGQSTSSINKQCSIKISSRVTDYKSTISCLVVPVITGHIPSFPFDLNKLSIPGNIHLSDPTYSNPRDVDLLLGANVFWNLLLDEKIALGTNLPTLVNTQFGWIVTGSISMTTKNYFCHVAKIHVPEDDQLRKFWEIEDAQSINQFMSPDNTICESLFDKDTFRTDNGQFVVKFPLKHSPDLLGDSKDTAHKRFKSLENKFRNEQFKQLYFEFIHEYENLGHMRMISDNCIFNYFLPHHGVLKESSLTTRLRIVFDGSCESSSGWSLNDIQYTGPKIQNDILDILLRFRTYAYVVSADISKMYRQILMNSEHQPLQKILWRENVNSDFSVYQLTTVTYGTRSAPYLAIKCIKKLAQDNFHEFPIECKTIFNDMYVDDLLTGSNDANELKNRCKNIYNILKSAHFILRKWSSNNFDIISDFTTSEISDSILNIGDQDTSKTLGIQWINKCDSLQYSIAPFTIQTPITKRYMLSIIAKIYDPLGLLSPTIILAKIWIQRLWLLHLPWDSEVPLDIETSWIEFQQGLYKLNSLTIPRNVISKELIDIHCFCDASRDAYGACVYLRSIDGEGNYYTQLLCSKSKVAPLKMLTIPKLELCGCLLGAKLTDRVVKSLNSHVPIFMWSDSQVALSWIQMEPSELQVFVANRVANIQSISNKTDWKYINTSSNPADPVSRGIKPEQLLFNPLWWEGPTFLRLPIGDWPDVNFLIPKSELTETRKVANAIYVTKIEPSDLITAFSKWDALHRISTYCLRFAHNVRNKHKITGPLTVNELEYTNTVLIKQVQLESFPEELAILQKNKVLPPNHKLSSLCPFVDNKGVLRVGGRLRNTYLPFSTKHPVLLSSKHHFTKLIFDHKHKLLLHPGPQMLLSSVRQFYWPIGGRILAKTTVKECLTCFKFSPVPFETPMSNLPNERIKPTFPFLITGIDYAGPFSILNKRGRGAKLIKCYIALFVCFCTKAVHIEIVTDLTTESFLACLKRFTSRRGVPTTIYSDNGSTFIGAHNQLKELGKFLYQNRDPINDFLSQFRIKWNFIPPYTPNHGGLWEAAVKSTKHYLKRILLNKNVTYEEFNTLVIQVEGIINSRPLFDLSSDPNDLAPLTPSHFLVGRPIISIPDYDLSATPPYRLSRWQHIQQLYQQFWRQFSKHYISQLHQQYKWKGAPIEIKPDTLVLIKQISQPPCKWPLGRITKLIPGRDGISRIAEVFTSGGTITRSVRHLCPLPLQTDSTQ